MDAVNDFSRFESIQAFEAKCREMCLWSDMQERHKPKWTGETWDQFNDRLHNGYTGAVGKATEVMDRIDQGVNLAGLAPTWGRSVAGSYPCVPAHLAGDHEAMFIRKPAWNSTLGPINIYIDTCGSFGVSAKKLFDRGCIVLAAVMALSRVRPVNCYSAGAYSHGNHLVKIQTNPMVMSEAAYLITSQAFSRTMAFGFARHFGFCGGWCDWANPDRMTVEERIAGTKKFYGLQEDDIVILGMASTDEQGIMADPVKWINGLLDQYRA